MNADEIKKTNEIVKMLRNSCAGCNPTPCCEFEMLGPAAADLIESLQAALAESQRSERAAVEDLVAMAECKLLGTCTFCVHRNTPDARYAPCKGCIQPNRSRLHFEWRGLQESGKGEAE